MEWYQYIGWAVIVLWFIGGVIGVLLDPVF